MTLGDDVIKTIRPLKAWESTCPNCDAKMYINPYIGHKFKHSTDNSISCHNCDFGIVPPFHKIELNPVFGSPLYQHPTAKTGDG